MALTQPHTHIHEKIHTERSKISQRHAKSRYLAMEKTTQTQTIGVCASERIEIDLSDLQADRAAYESIRSIHALEWDVTRSRTRAQP